jgi:hypothetical protein
MDNEKSQEILRLITGKKIAYQRAVALSIQDLTEDERNWIRVVLSGDDYNSLEISPSYSYRIKTEIERNLNKGIVRKELDTLRKKLRKFTPEELLEIKNEKEREIRGIENFAGIYIIHNRIKDMYYVGQSESVFDRVNKHFVINPETKSGRYKLNVLFNLPEIYNDYNSGDEFIISLIPLVTTSFPTLNELEDNAIRAYDSLVPLGYNRNSGNKMDKPIFKDDDYQKVADLLLEKITGTEMFSSLSNDSKRIEYTRTLFSELVLKSNSHFLFNFVKMIKVYQKANKKSINKK